MKKIIITGSNGQLGRAINDLYGKDSDYEFVNTDYKSPILTRFLKWCAW